MEEISICLVAKRPYKFVNRNGAPVEGTTYAGYLEEKNGKAWLAFSSKSTYDLTPSLKKYDPERAEVITLYRRLDIFTGKEKWADYPQENTD